MYAFAIGIATFNSQQQIIEAYFPQPQIDIPDEEANILSQLENGVINASQLASLQSELPSTSPQYNVVKNLSANDNGNVVVCRLDENIAPTTVLEAYLKLQLLSHRLVKPHQTNLTGIFGTLVNIAWTNEGAIDMQDLPARQLAARSRGSALQVNSVDKFPKMTDYVVPEGVRIADASRVRLGAYLGKGTTVMHEGFVNFNAGCEGPNMIEGRISAGVWVGSGSDLGGGCSTMGTLSGGGEVVISVGKNCLLGANSGIGIPLGNNCTVEAGLYITAGTKVTIIDEQRQPVKQYKASELMNQNDLLFRRNSVNGAVECLATNNNVVLNSELHNN